MSVSHTLAHLSLTKDQTASLIHSIWIWVYVEICYSWKAKQWKLAVDGCSSWITGYQSAPADSECRLAVCCSLAQGEGGKVRYFLLSKCGHQQVNHRDAQPLSSGPRASTVSSLCCVWGERHAGQTDWLELDNEACSTPAKRPASQPNPHINKNKKGCNNRQLAFHRRSAEVHFSLSSSLLKSSLWFELDSWYHKMKQYILVLGLSDFQIYNYPGCINRIDQRLNRSPCYLLQPPCSS